MGIRHGSEEAGRRNHLRLRALALSLGLGLAGTAALGGALFLVQQNVWWVALGGLLSLFSAGVYLGWRSREPEPLYGVLLALLYFGLVVAILFGGELAEALPDPLPGLAIGDSTFFFVWPLLMLVAAVAGSVLGGRQASRRISKRASEFDHERGKRSEGH